MINPESPSDRAEEKREQSRDSSMAKKEIARAKKCILRQLRKEKKILKKKKNNKKFLKIKKTEQT